MTNRLADWTRDEVETAVADYFDMLAAELSTVPYNKASHRRRLAERLNNRSAPSIEFKHCNISAVLLDLGFPYIAGYKPRSNYQTLLFDVVAERLVRNDGLLRAAEADADQPIAVPEVDDILAVLTTPPNGHLAGGVLSEPPPSRPVLGINYLEREARNRSLGLAGESFVINFERARLISCGKRALAHRIEHVSRIRGDAEGFDILSFEESGHERLIEVKTTKYGQETPFFVSRNELSVSEAQLSRYHLYRLFRFRASPQLFVLSGALSRTCALAPVTFMASVRPSADPAY